MTGYYKYIVNIQCSHKVAHVVTLSDIFSLNNLLSKEGLSYLPCFGAGAPGGMGAGAVRTFFSGGEGAKKSS